MATLLAIGELLWDEFPTGARLGGAPANVAFHLAQAGHRALLASAVGADERGREALATLGAAGVDIKSVAALPAHATGTVRVELDDHGVPAFDIVDDVAWDHIPLGEPLLALAARTEAVIFGTLAQRRERSRATITAVLEAAPHAMRVLDLNLRPPFFTPEVIRSSLEQATILKLSDGEVTTLQSLMAGHSDSQTFLRQLATTFGLERIYVTCGAAGCEVFDEGGGVREPSQPTTVVDTVGAGDAFTAAMVCGELAGWEVRAVARRANAAGAYVAAHAGAMPAWSAELRARLGVSGSPPG